MIGYLRGAEISSNRGFNSITPEPSFYSIQMIFTAIVIYLCHLIKRISKIVLILSYLFLAVQVFLLAQAASGIVFLCLFFILILIANRKFFILTLISGMLYFFMNLTCYFFSSTRIAYIFSLLIEQPIKILNDKSANQRLTDIILSVYGFIKQYPFQFGYGTDSWTNYAYENYQNFNFLAPPISSSKIMSGYGSVLFETGLFGLFFLIIPYSYYLFKIRDVNCKAIALFMILFMFSALQVSNPLFGFIFGITIYLSYNLRTKNDAL